MRLHGCDNQGGINVKTEAKSQLAYTKYYEYLLKNHGLRFQNEYLLKYRGLRLQIFILVKAIIAL